MLAGTLDTRAHRAWVMRHRRARLATCGALALVVRPRLAWVFLRTRASGYRHRLLDRSRAAPRPTTVHGGAAEERIAVLLHVAVDATERSDGPGEHWSNRSSTSRPGLEPRVPCSSPGTIATAPRASMNASAGSTPIPAPIGTVTSCGSTTLTFERW